MKKLSILLTFVFAIIVSFSSCENEISEPQQDEITVQITVKDKTPESLKSEDDDDPWLPVFGEVKTKDGKPLKQAQLSLYSGGSLKSTAKTYFTTTDNDGCFTFEKVYLGSYQLDIAVDGKITKTLRVDL